MANSRSWGRPRVRERGDVRAHDDRDEEELVRSQMSSTGWYAMSTTTPFAAIVDSAGFQTLVFVFVFVFVVVCLLCFVVCLLSSSLTRDAEACVRSRNGAHGGHHSLTTTFWQKNG